jgi:hypothetical protein
VAWKWRQNPWVNYGPDFADVPYVRCGPIFPVFYVVADHNLFGHRISLRQSYTCSAAVLSVEFDAGGFNDGAACELTIAPRRKQGKQELGDARRATSAGRRAV